MKGCLLTIVTGSPFSFHKKENSMIRLECTRGGSNKFYELHLLKNPKRVIVKGFYGKIGSAPNEHMVYDGDNLETATKELSAKKQEKLKKGYVLVSGEAAEEEENEPAPAKNELPIIWPMNAQGVGRGNQVAKLLADSRYIAQEKLDGMRAVVHITRSGLRIFSRNAGVNDPKRPLEKTSSLPHLASIKIAKLVGTILDCELLAPGADSASIAGRVNSGDNSHTVHLYVFDVLAFCGIETTFSALSKRLILLNSITPIISSEFVHVLPWAESTLAKTTLYKEVMDSKSEGLMFKNLHASYEKGARPRDNWIKFKKEASFDCVVMGFTTGKGKYNTHIGAVRFGQYVDGKLVELGQASGMTDEIRREMTISPGAYLDKVITIRGQERLKSGAIRHPRFIGLNTTKRPQECIWYPGEQ